MDMKELVKPFVDVTINTFTTFVGCDLSPKQPFFTDKEMDLNSDITGIIGISGVVRGAVIISMKMELAKIITGILTGSPPSEVDVSTDMVDAIGEITNIIAGNVKQKIPNGDHMVISLPTVIRGLEHSIIWPSKERRILCIPFEVTEKGVFHILVAFGAEDPDSASMAVP
ncbi:MAG: chemotaxis protein CheX [Treponema sp.]|jgi:chemotaxis protein CheX|nr:chemotaxis protein CheX [Treponema sp.]